MVSDGSSFMNTFKSVDFYRKLPQDLTEPTLSGAAVSIVSTCIMVFLFLSELTNYLSITTTSEMFIDVNRGGEKLHINVDLSFYNSPCGILSLDVQDIMGTHVMDIKGTLFKKTLNSKAEVIAVEEYKMGKAASVEETMKGLDNKEGCRIEGYIIVNKVPGNFHISSHAFGDIVRQIYATGRSIDFSHRIHHISFGSDQDMKIIRKRFDKGILNPLDETSVDTSNQKINFNHHYYLNVVPTTYTDLAGREFYVHQFTSNKNSVQVNMLPAVFFRFELSPVTVLYTQHKENIWHFLVDICAIIGGVFTVSGIIDALIHKSVVTLFKSRIGKIS